MVNVKKNTSNGIKKNYYMPKSENKHLRSCADQDLVKL